MELKLRTVKLILEILAVPARFRFERTLRNPARAQAKTLAQILSLTGRETLPATPTTWADYPEGCSWTREKPLFFEYTSGSSGRKKAVPYTKALRSSFGRLFLLWSTDLLCHVPLRTGRSFISISPKLQCLGMTTDFEYLNPALAFLLKSFLITEPADQLAVDGVAFQTKMRERLTAATDLEIISIWSPSYLLTLLDGMDLVPARHWPHLKLISVWGDASSAPGFSELTRRFPQARLQKKGLLATEAPMTLPLCQAEGAVPLWDEVYLEVIGADGKIRPLWELAPGEEGELLISTRGGLVRYRMEDRVRVTGHYKASPLIEFLGRTGQASDLVGEKLSEEILLPLFSSLDADWSLHADDGGYTFVTTVTVTEQWIEAQLRTLHHYALARELGQLRAVRVVHEPRLRELKSAFAEARGLKLGDVKAKFLWANPEFLHWRHLRSVPPSQPAAAAPTPEDPNLRV